MYAVVSQAWAYDAGEHADAYQRLTGEFSAFMRQHPGFLGRRVLRSVENPRHFTHIRLFDRIESYEELTKMPGYMDWITKISQHTERTQTYPREYFEVVIDEDPLR